MKYDELVNELRQHDDYRLYEEADVLMSYAADAITALQDELEQCRKDAERYRWLRDKNDDPELYLVTAPEELDAAIDKAMESV